MKEFPCELHEQYDELSGGVWTCTSEMGECTVCGLYDGLPWEPMRHEQYGLWWVSDK